MTNPILTEINGLSPEAKTALMAAHTSAAPSSPLAGTSTPAPAAKMQAPSSISAPPTMGAPPALPPPAHGLGGQVHSAIGQQEQGPAPNLSTPTMPSASPSLGAPNSTEVSKPVPGTTQGDTLERQRLLATGSGASQIKNPVLRGLAGVGNAIGSIAAPGIMREIPGTQEHHNLLLSQNEKNIGNDLGIGQKEATIAGDQASTEGKNLENLNEPQKVADTHALSGATTANLESETAHRGDQKDEWKELAGYTGPKGEPLEINSATGQTRVAQGSEGALRTAPTKEQNPQQQTYDSLLKSGMTPMQAYEKIREKPGGTTINQGTWALDEDSTTGKPVLFNSKTGETREGPANVAKAGTFAKKEAATEPAKQAMEYANDYANRSVHTGPGDEALMEKFFELAKPSTGFRMSQPQIDMLKNAQSWQGSLEAHLRHATTGTWFSDDQRKEIAATMGDLAKAKGLTPGGTSPQGGAAPVEGATKVNSAGDKVVFKGGKWGPA